jgi:ankyrin repeat protein
MQERKPLQGNVPAEKPAKHNVNIAPSEKPKLSAEEQNRLNDALLEAVRNNEKNEIERLIKKGADIAAKGDDSWTALHWAAGYGLTEICALLLEQYAKAGGNIKELITAKGSLFGWTPLDWASKRRGAKTAQFLAVKLLEATFGNETAAAFMKSFNECISDGG